MKQMNEFSFLEENFSVNRPSLKLFNARNFLLALATVLVLSVAYYFVIALPAHNGSMLELERERFQKGQEAKAKEEYVIMVKQISEKVEAEAKERMLNICFESAGELFWDFIRVNGTEVKNKKGVYIAPPYVWQIAQIKRKDVVDECHRKWGPR